MAFQLKPAEFRRGEPMFCNSDIRKSVTLAINNGVYFYSYKVKEMNDDMKKAAAVLDEAEVLLNDRINKYVQTQQKITDQTKKISGSIRESTQKMAEGLLRIEKQANFDNLERYVNLLERANTALSSLAELEKNGKLNKISDALK